MNYYRKLNNTTLFFWVMLLSIALLCAQGVKLHVHNLGHEHGDQHTHDSIQTTAHDHLSIAHLSTDVSHSDHHTEVVSESDACPDCLLTKITNKTPFMALLVILISLALFGLYQITFSRRCDDKIIFYWRCHLIPPLRAPPR